MINQDFNSILDLIKAFPDEQSCIEHLETLRWDGNVVSPFDASSKVYNCKGNRYKCKNTGKYFNVKTDSLFDNTKIKLQKWFHAIWLVTSNKKGISSLQLGRDLDITQKSAWFMLHRIRNCFGIENNDDLNNDVEADETYVGGKNNKVIALQDKSVKDKTPVVGTTELNDNIIENVGSTTLTSEIIATVKEGATLYKAVIFGYKGVSRIYDHSKVKHKQRQIVNGRVHTNNIVEFWSLLKRGIFDIYHLTSKKHFHMYVDEFVFRYSARKSTEAIRFNLLLSNSNNRLTYKELIG